MKPLSGYAQAILDAIPDHGWIDPIILQRESGLSLGEYHSHVAVLKRRGLVERDEFGHYRRTVGAS